MIQPCRSAEDVDELVVVELHARMRCVTWMVLLQCPLTKLCVVIDLLLDMGAFLVQTYRLR